MFPMTEIDWARIRRQMIPCRLPGKFRAWNREDFLKDFGQSWIALRENYYTSYIRPELERGPRSFGDTVSMPILKKELRRISEFFSGDSENLSSLEAFVKKDQELLLESQLLNIPSDPGCHDDATAQFFISRKGTLVDLHYDWQSSWNIVHVVTGEKIFKFMPPAISESLDPISNFSSFNIQNPSDRRKIDALAKDEWCFHLKAGEALAFPPFWWHYVEYVEDSASVTYRVGSHRAFHWLVTFLPPVFQIGKNFQKEEDRNNFISHFFANFDMSSLGSTEMFWSHLVTLIPHLKRSRLYGIEHALLKKKLDFLLHKEIRVQEERKIMSGNSSGLFRHVFPAPDDR